MLTNAGPTIIVGTRTRGTRVSSSPSKIPYGGFSPVRLQTGFPPRPSPARGGANLHPAPAYTRLKSLSPERAASRRGACAQAALSPSDGTLPSRGPWLASGLFCPAGSSLTMTSSETLGSSEPTYAFAVRWYLRREVPQFTPPVSFFRAVFRTPVDRTTAPGFSFIVRFGLPHLCKRSASTSHALRFRRGRVTRLQSSLHGTARKIASPAPARAFTFELSPPESPQKGVEYNYAGKSANSRGRICTGKTSSIMGCGQRSRRTRRRNSVNLCVEVFFGLRPEAAL